MSDILLVNGDSKRQRIQNQQKPRFILERDRMACRVVKAQDMLAKEKAKQERIQKKHTHEVLFLMKKIKELNAAVKMRSNMLRQKDAEIRTLRKRITQLDAEKKDVQQSFVDFVCDTHDTSTDSLSDFE